jgi:hypothetical protein
MTFKQFRSPANNDARMRNGRGSRDYRLQSKLDEVISLRRLEFLLTQGNKNLTKPEV